MEKVLYLDKLKDIGVVTDDFLIITMKVSGIKEPIKIKYNLLIKKDLYVTVGEPIISYSTVTIGDGRKEVINEQLKSLWKDKELYVPIIQEDGFVFGEHDFYLGTNDRYSRWNNRSEHNIRFIEKVTFEHLDKLLLLEGDDTFDIYYYKDYQILVGGEPQFISCSDEDVLKQIESCFDLSYYSNFSVDQYGNFYRVTPITDIETIRLFPKGEADKIESKTFCEFLANKGIPVPKNIEYPYDFGVEGVQGKLYSEKVFGSAIPTFNKGEWIKLGNKYGCVQSQNGTNIEILWETDMKCGWGDYTDYLLLTKVPSPLKTLSKPRLVKIHTDDKLLKYAYAYLVAETPNAVRVRFLMENEQELISTLTCLYGYSRNWGQSHEECIQLSIKEFQKYYDTDQYFLVFSKEEYSELSVRELELFKEHIMKRTPIQQHMTFKRLLEMLDISKGNQPYFFIQIESLIQRLGIFEVINQLLDFHQKKSSKYRNEKPLHEFLELLKDKPVYRKKLTSTSTNEEKTINMQPLF